MKQCLKFFLLPLSGFDTSKFTPAKLSSWSIHASQLAAGWLLLFLVACAGGTPEYKAAREFIDAYYVMANQTAAIELTSDFARAKLEDEIKLLEGVGARSQSYQTRDIEFKLLKEQASGAETHFLFDLTLHIPQLGPQKRQVALTVDRNTRKIKFFGEVNDVP